MTETKNSTWNQKLNSISTLKSDIRSIFRSSKKDKTNFADILSSIKLRIYDRAKYKTLPNYCRSEINGYIQANFDLMSDFTTWSHWQNGKFVGTKLVFGKNFDQKKVVSARVYNNTEIIYS